MRIVVVEQQSQNAPIRIAEEHERVGVDPERTARIAGLGLPLVRKFQVRARARPQLLLDDHRIPFEAVAVGDPDDRDLCADTPRHVNEAAAAEGFVIRVWSDHEHRIVRGEGPERGQ